MNMRQDGKEIPGQPQRYRVDHLLAALTLSVMALVAFANILGRYLFDASLSFTEEITIQLFVWLVVIGSGMAFERGAQLGMTSLFRVFPRAVQKSVILFSAALGALLFVVVDLLLLQAIYREMTIFHARSGSLNVPVWIYYAGVPLFSCFVFRGIWRGARSALCASSGKGGG
ncbi:MAG: TRAP transporter small permease [Spartobacteria bacterium]|nr:TRAP transporter small permease [Spartobacteria bacterium]